MRFITFSILILSMGLIACQDDDDRCEDLTCFNGGVCLDGVCDCPPGYVGFNCQDYDACDSTSCLNGGTCEMGICDCPPGYSGINCEDFDPCADITCENGGTCLDGICECPQYYQGVTCSEQITPSTVSLTGIHVTLFPTLDENGLPWDMESSPDILPQISKGNQVLYTAPSPSINANVGENITWTISEPLNFSELFDVHTFKLLEVDESGDPREMDRFFFSPYNSNNDFPAILEFTSDSLSFKLLLEYTW